MHLTFPPLAQHIHTVVSHATDGLQQLQAFIRAHGLTIADLHQGLVKRFGREKAGCYRRVHSWATGARRPDEEGRSMLREACAIAPYAWLTPEEIEREKWIGAAVAV